MYTSNRDITSYIESGIWKCSQSPTKAHHWVGNNIEMECKYCHQKQKVEFRVTTWEISHRQGSANKKKL